MLIREAALMSLNHDINTDSVSEQFINLALVKVKPRISEAMINEYYAFQQMVGIIN